jgi:glycerophosphoryl diester phosphodiesterase
MTSGPLPAMNHAPRFLVAHRAGNHLCRLDDAARHGARLIECDLRLYRGRIEVRHLHSVGPLPIFWDTWQVASPFARRLQLHELLAAADPLGLELMLDLKGRDPRLSRMVVEQLACRPQQLPVTVCARHWGLLGPFHDLPHVRTVCSVGTRRGLRRLLSQRRERRLGGVSIHAGLLDPEVVLRLGEAAELVMTWPVNCTERARTLLDWGVHGLITDHAHMIAPLVAPRTADDAATGALARS